MKAAGGSKGGSMMDMTIIMGILGNILSVVGVVLCNKYIITRGFNYMMILSACHFAFTWLGCHVLLHFGYFKYKRPAFKNLLPVSLGSLGSVAFMNLNLAYNSIGFYQLSKLLCIPFTIGVQRVLFHQEASTAVKLTLVPILLGLALATVHDVSVNFVGTVFAIIAVVITTFSQFFTQRYQAALECNALQLLYLTSPIICCGMIALSPFFDDISHFRTHFLRLGNAKADDDDIPGSRFTLVIWIMISCILALGVNISNYLVLGKTSPLTYQVLGHLKTVLIIVLGVLLFRNPVDFKQFLGVCLAVAGVVAYTEVKRKQSLHPPSRLPR